VLPSSLQVSIVTYQPDLPLLERALDTLGIAIDAAQDTRVLKTVHLALIDNSGDRGIAERVIEMGRARFADQPVHVMFLHGHANIGFGAAHNLVLHGTGADYHLVLNPDAELAADALVNGIRWLDEHPDVGALAPAVADASGRRQYLCKRYPAVLDLLLRGFAPPFVQRWFERRLALYEMRDVVDVDPPRDAIGVPIMSGAFVLARREAVDLERDFAGCRTRQQRRVSLHRLPRDLRTRVAGSDQQHGAVPQLRRVPVFARVHLHDARPEIPRKGRYLRLLV